MHICIRFSYVLIFQERESTEEEKRATYLDTRELDTEFKDVIFTALTEVRAIIICLLLILCCDCPDNLTISQN